MAARSLGTGAAMAMNLLRLISRSQLTRPTSVVYGEGVADEEDGAAMARAGAGAGGWGGAGAGETTPDRRGVWLGEQDQEGNGAEAWGYAQPQAHRRHVAGRGFGALALV